MTCHRDRIGPTLAARWVLLISMLTVVATAAGGSVVTIDDRGHLVVDGKPFFPLGFYLARPATTTCRVPPRRGQYHGGSECPEELSTR